MRLKL
jgi:hypothetical protein